MAAELLATLQGVSWEVWAVLAVVVLVLTLFIRETFPVPVTAMLGSVLLALLGILTPAEMLSGFSSEATAAVLALFVLSAGIERTGAVNVLAEKLITWAGRSPRRQVLAMGGVAGPVSGFINNTAVVALLLPVANRMARASQTSPSKLLMPLSFIAMLGGTLTLVGTSTNLLGNALLPQFGIEPFGFFSFTVVGLIGLATTVLFFLTFGMRLLPDRGHDFVAQFDLKGFIAEFEVRGDGEVAGRTLREAGLTRDRGIQVLRVYRGEEIHGAPRGNFQVEPGDLLLVQASRERLEELPRTLGIHSLAEQQHALEDPEEEEEGELATAELVLTPGSRLEGKTLADVDFRERYDALVIAVRHHARVAIGPLSNTRLAAGDVLLVQAEPSALDRLEQHADFVLARERNVEHFRREQLPVAIAIFGAVVAVAALGQLNIVVAALAGAVAMVLSGCLKMEEFLSSIRWDIILLLAGVIPLGIALQKTGGADLLASGLTAVGGWFGPLGFLIVVFVVTSLITQVISNNAAVVILLPVAVTAAAALGHDPRPFALAVMLAASMAMLTPIGYQTNTMVYAPGNYRFSDFLRVGGPLNLILAVVVPLGIWWWFG